MDEGPWKTNNPNKFSIKKISKAKTCTFLTILIDITDKIMHRIASGLGKLWENLYISIPKHFSGHVALSCSSKLYGNLTSKAFLFLLVLIANRGKPYCKKGISFSFLKSYSMSVSASTKNCPEPK